MTPSKRVDAYFDSIGWKPFRFQRSAWRAYADGASGLIHSATGTGKTLAVWLGPILHWMRSAGQPAEWPDQAPPALKVLWITPLRALAGDTEHSLRAPLEALGLPWSLESRTGDSKASRKARQLKRLPTALLTTPESLSLLLTHQQLLEQLAGVECVIVDEWHELLGTKRGVQTELALSRLRKLNPQLRTWGVSATLGNLEEALQSLVGVEPQRPTRIIRGFQKKRLKFESLVPDEIERFPWSGHIGTKMVPQVAALLDSVSSALVFANTRSQTEIWYQQLLKHRPDWAGQIALHHGSLDSSVRHWVENGLRSGALRAVVCTSSLDLGVDFTAVELVIQIGSPKGSARLLQRAGRSGHQPTATSRLVFVPTHALELVELAAAQEAIRGGRLEARLLLQKPLDVLAQHLVTLAIGGGFQAPALLDEVRSSWVYRDLTDEEWQWVLDFVTRGGSALQAYPEFQRVEVEDERYQVKQRKTMTMHRMNIGTIVSDAAMHVKYVKGTPLGNVEESFVAKLSPGDRFLFAGRLVELVRVRDTVAYVRRAKGQANAIPRWAGGRMPLSSELSAELRRKLEQASEGELVGREMKCLVHLFELQNRWSKIPAGDELLIEQLSTRGGFQFFFYPFEGRLVHEGLAALLALRLSRQTKTCFSIACNDYGFLLQSPHEFDIAHAIEQGILQPVNLETDILSTMNATEMAKRQFRQVARVAGLIHPGYPGRRKTSSHVQASSNMFFDVFQRYDPANLLLEQSRREVLEHQLEAHRLQQALERIALSEVVCTRPPQPTPLSFPLLVDKLRERLSSESLAERVQRMLSQLERAAD